MPSDEITIQLTRDELDTLTMGLGVATGWATEHDAKLAVSFLRLVNTIHRNSPNFTPYEVPGERPRKDAV